MRKPISIEFGRRMSVRNASVAMHQGASMGCTVWVNKDIRNAAKTGDWTELLEKAQKSTINFRNQFYR